MFIFLWIIFKLFWWVIVIVILDLVIVFILVEIIGIFNLILFDNCMFKLMFFGKILDCVGINNILLNVNDFFVNLFFYIKNSFYFLN